MEDLITVFRMSEISSKTRANIIIKLGQLINHQYASNITEPLVWELVNMLDKDNPILKDEHYIRLNPTLAVGERKFVR